LKLRQQEYNSTYLVRLALATNDDTPVVLSELDIYGLPADESIVFVAVDILEVVSLLGERPGVGFLHDVGMVIADQHPGNIGGNLWHDWSDKDKKTKH